MLSDERNKLLCETGRGTPMGELLRRYWHPVAGAAEFREQDVKPVRIFGEDLALYLPDAALLIHDGWTLSAATAARYASITDLARVSGVVSAGHGCGGSRRRADDH